MKFYFYIFSTLAVLFLPVGLWAAEPADHLFVYLAIRQDGSVLADEEILFSSRSSQQGVFIRTIPLRLQTPYGTVRLRVADVQVVDVNDVAYPFVVRQTNDAAEIRIDTPSVSTDGQQFYIVRYRVDGAILPASGHDYFFWNATGSGWTGGIKEVSVKVDFPSPVTIEANLLTDCTVVGATSRVCDQQPRAYDQQGGIPSVGFQQDSGVIAGESLVVSVALPSGVLVQPPSAGQKFIQEFMLPALAVVAVLCLGVLARRQLT